MVRRQAHRELAPCDHLLDVPLALSLRRRVHWPFVFGGRHACELTDGRPAELGVPESMIELRQMFERFGDAQLLFRRARL